ncbi:MFS transporter [Dactylosporangium aurantiacum]|uniref:MFS transporter n=1 Tax=Dactylosporangium aurantiacum TaxID=35754 RepID=A0A9Q9IE04_9ACTN|nr:MFS transporter [Dactylosporangium aurantiacum]MDG6107512.1 MFS transporter [Dactylosporangium aurantiacum]UWZ54302.1 MFS transporter [Dactylosporangium aurantiacum]
MAERVRDASGSDPETTPRGFRLLLGARGISYAGDALSMVALMLHVASSTGQALAVSALLLAGDFVPSLVAPFAGALADRFDRRRLMIGCELVQALTVAVIALALPPLWPLLGLVAVRAVAGQVFQPASRAAVPSLVPAAGLAAGNARLGLVTNVAELAGPLLAAALLPWLGTRGVLAVDAASFVVSAALLTGLPRLAPAALSVESLWKGARTGLGYLAGHRTVRVVALGFCAVVLCTGVDDVALVVLAQQDLRTGDAVAALLLGAVGLGLTAGYALLSRRGDRLGDRLGMPVLFAAGLAVSSAGNLLTGAVAHVAWAAAVVFTMQAGRGLGIAAIDVASNTLLQRLVPDGLLGRVFANLYGAVGAAAALSYVLGGLLLDAAGAPATLVAAGAGGVVCALLTGAALRARRVD